MDSTSHKPQPLISKNVTGSVLYDHGYTAEDGTFFMSLAVSIYSWIYLLICAWFKLDPHFMHKSLIAISNSLTLIYNPFIFLITIPIFLIIFRFVPHIKIWYGIYATNMVAAITILSMPNKMIWYGVISAIIMRLLFGVLMVSYVKKHTKYLSLG